MTFLQIYYFHIFVFWELFDKYLEKDVYCYNSYVIYL